MQKSPNVAALAVMVNATHHQRGAGCSTTPEMRSVSQLKLRRFKTSGTCAIRCSASLIFSGAAAGAPSITKLPIANRQLPTATIQKLTSRSADSSFRSRAYRPCDAGARCFPDIRVWIAYAREITGCCDKVQIRGDLVLAVLLFHF